MVDWAVRAAGIVLAVYMLVFSRQRLDCLFFSAFETSQALLIKSALPKPLWALGIQHWLFTRFYDSWKGLLLCACWLSALFIPCSLLLRGGILYIAAAVYSLSMAAVIAYWLMSRVTARDQRRHLPCNAFAPLNEHQRRELNHARNGLQLTPLFQQLDMFRKSGDQPVTSVQEQEIRERYRNY